MHILSKMHGINNVKVIK